MILKIIKTSKRLPKLLPINPKKRRYQIASKRCIVWWKWQNSINSSTMNPTTPRFATLYVMGWQIEGISGSTEVLAWAYIPENIDEL